MKASRIVLCGVVLFNYGDPSCTVTQPFCVNP